MKDDRDTRLRIAKPDIIKILESQPKRVFDRGEISALLEENREYWRLSASTGRNYFIRYLIQNTPLTEKRFNFPNAPKLKYAWGDISPLEVVMTLDQKAYCTHLTAMFIHNLTEQVPRTIYLNVEQPAKPTREASLTQERIDAAFKRPQRVSKNVADFEEYRVCLLGGKFTDNAGVVEMTDTNGTPVRVTNIERTLIDIVVRPAYAGGSSTVLTAYEKAAGIVSVNKMTAMLGKLNYTYPYHQAIGFYLEKSRAYSESAVELMNKFKIEFDFYLVHGMKEMDYDEKWHLYYPKGL